MIVLPQILRLFRGVLPALALLVLAPCCRRIPLYDPCSGIFLQLDIRLADETGLSADIDYDADPDLLEKVRGRMPERVRVCFYDAVTHALAAEDFLPAEGGFIDIPAGTYDLLVYSLGCESTRISDGGGRTGVYAFTGGNENAVIQEPDHLFAGRIPGVTVPVRAEMDRTVVINCELTTILETYTLEVKHVEGAGRIREAEVYVSGQAPGKYLWDRRFQNKPCAVAFRCRIDAGKGHLFSVFNTFGKLPGVRSDVYLQVLATSEDGGRYQWTFDVTDQFDNPDNIGHEIIIDEPVTVPESGTGGLLPTVGNWNTEVTELPLSWARRMHIPNPSYTNN